MKSRIHITLVASAIVALTALPLSAQDHATHAATAKPSAGVSSSLRTGGFAPSGQTWGRTVPATPAPSVNEHRRPVNRYGRPYGASILLPYDSEAGQLEGHGTLDHEQAEVPEQRSGPTIFEHDGQAMTSGNSADVRTAPQAEERTGKAGPSTVLVYRDGHQQEIENYAIAGDKLIVLGEKTQKILLSELDLGATAKANQDRGVDFKTPKQS
jgi:hypothetical protein